MLFRRFGLFVAFIALLGLVVSALIQPSRSHFFNIKVEERLNLLQAHKAWKHGNIDTKSASGDA